jgi:hypothetical protein
MIKTSDKTMTEAYWDMVNKLSNNHTPTTDNPVEDLPAPPNIDWSVATPEAKTSSHGMGESIEYHNMGWMEKLNDKITTWLRKQAN